MEMTTVLFKWLLYFHFMYLYICSKCISDALVINNSHNPSQRDKFTRQISAEKIKFIRSTTFSSLTCFGVPMEKPKLGAMGLFHTQDIIISIGLVLFRHWQLS